MSKKIVILGDSIAKGIVFSEEKNRYTRLDGDCVSRIAQMSGDLEIRNLASMGRTSADALASLDHTQISAGDYVVVEYGGTTAICRGSRSRKRLMRFMKPESRFPSSPRVLPL